jgi:hypothetical protein
MKILASLSLLTGLVLASTAALGGTFYCGTHIIKEGDSKAKVEEHCGQPTSQSYDQWVYDRGENKFTITLHFEADGTVNRIEETDPNPN